MTPDTPPANAVPRPLFGVLPPPCWPEFEDLGGWRPPRHLARLHLPGFAEGLWLRLLAAVRDPVQVFEPVQPGCPRRVAILGSAVLRIRECGRVEPLLLGRDSEGVVRFLRTHERLVGLHPMPYGWGWLDLMRDAAAVELAFIVEQTNLQAQAHEVQQYAKALFAWFRRRLARHADLRWMRRRVAAALALDADAMRLACRLLDAPVCGSIPRLSHYNSALRHKPALLRLEREMPQALPLYTALHDDADFPRSPSPVRALRTVLRRKGIRPATWRLLVSASPRLLLPVRHFYQGDGGDALVDYLHILQDMGLKREPPAWLMWAVLSQAANPGSRLEMLHHSLADSLPAFGHVVRSLEALPEGSVPRADVLRVLDWVGRERPVLDKPRLRAGWPWLRKAGQAWALEQAMALDDTPWPTPVDSLAGFDHWGTPLTSRLALWHEATAMHHCVDNYADACAAGDAMVLSVTHLKRPGERVATALLKRNGRAWALVQLRGFANRDPEPEVERAVQRMVHHLNLIAHFGRTEVFRPCGPRQGATVASAKDPPRAGA